MRIRETVESAKEVLIFRSQKCVLLFGKKFVGYLNNGSVPAWIFILRRKIAGLQRSVTTAAAAAKMRTTIILTTPKMLAAAALTLLASTSVLAQNPPPSGGDPPFVPPAVNRATLNDLYKSTGGPQWKVSTGWGTDSDYCTWYGVTCVYTNHNITTHIRLAQNNLVGTIPDNIGDLADLKVIDLSGNAISGTIPESLSKFFFFTI